MDSEKIFELRGSKYAKDSLRYEVDSIHKNNTGSESSLRLRNNSNDSIMSLEHLKQDRENFYQSYQNNLERRYFFSLPAIIKLT